MSADAIPGVIERSHPNAVIYDLTAPSHVKITLPPASTWSSGLHWHETHDEYLKVIKGSIRVTLGNKTQIITATEDNHPELKVGRYTWHEWQRAETTTLTSSSTDNQQQEEEEEVVVIERTEPVDIEKRLFFYNLNGVILNSPKILDNRSSIISLSPPRFRGFMLDVWITLQLYVIFHHLDNVPVFINLPSRVKPRGASSDILQNLLTTLEWFVSHAVLYLAGRLGSVLGVQPVRVEYTPAEEYDAWETEFESNKNKKHK